MEAARPQDLLRTSVVLFFVLTIWNQQQLQARADTSLKSYTGGVVSVQCFAFTGIVMQSNYGLWWMQQDALSVLGFKAVDINTSEIECHFVSLSNGDHQWFPVYKQSSGMATPCGLDCHWTITNFGFFLHDPVANNDVQVYSWLPAPDSWIEPVPRTESVSSGPP